MTEICLKVVFNTINPNKKNDPIIIICNILFQGDWRFSTRADPNGLVSGHAYTITEVRKETNETHITQIRQEPSFKQLEVKTNCTSFFCFIK
jgi:hypothetical protein